jgi:ureidoglycolate hydrolase
MKTIKAQRVTPENFQAFGKVVSVTAKAEPAAQSDIQTFYGQLAVMKCQGSVELGICVAKNRAFVVDTLEQHTETAELLAALRDDFIVPVTTSVVIDGKQYPDMEKVAAVRVNQGEGVVFDEGIWHWTPYAVTETCDVLVVFKTDTPKNDFTGSRLSEEITIEM